MQLFLPKQAITALQSPIKSVPELGTAQPQLVFSFFLSFYQLITQYVVVVVNLPSQAGTNCGQLYTNVYIHSHQI